MIIISVNLVLTVLTCSIRSSVPLFELLWKCSASKIPVLTTGS